MLNKASSRPIEEYAPLVEASLRYWRGKVRDVLLDDLRQEGLMVVWEKWQEWDGLSVSFFRRLLVACIRNRMSEFVRKHGSDMSVQRRPARKDEDPDQELANGSFRPLMIPFSEEDHSSKESYDPLEKICRDEKTDYIINHLSSLELTALRDKAYGVSLKESAEKLGYASEVSVSKLRSRAINKCRALARRWEVICEATI